MSMICFSLMCLQVKFKGEKWSLMHFLNNRFANLELHTHSWSQCVVIQTNKKKKTQTHISMTLLLLISLFSHIITQNQNIHFNKSIHKTNVGGYSTVMNNYSCWWCQGSSFLRYIVWLAVKMTAFGLRPHLFCFFLGIKPESEDSVYWSGGLDVGKLWRLH